MRFDRTTQRRLSDLTRGRVGGPVPGPQDAMSVPNAQEVDDADRVPGTGAPTRTSAPTRHVVGDPEDLHGPLEDLLPGMVRAVAEGELYQLAVPVGELGHWAVEAVQRCEETARCGRFPGPLHALRNVAPEQIVFFDTETTALSNAPLFLVGALAITADGPVIQQLLARDYSEEPAVLAEARRLLHQAELAVSYNGTGFDVPYLRDRLRYHRLGPIRLRGHLDLLPVARRKLGRSLGNCKLQTLELHLCRRQRCHDIAGQHIPQAYHDFVAEGDAWELRRIIEHNAYDIVTLAELAAHLAD